MSDGRYCIIRNLGPVKGGKGLKHHVLVVDFTWRTFAEFLLLGRDLVELGHSQIQTGH
jgi:hypothetical protein